MYSLFDNIYIWILIIGHPKAPRNETNWVLSYGRKTGGEKIYILLSKFLTLDLEKSLPNQYSCAQTLFVKVPILIVRNNNNAQIPEIDLFINRSHANYIYNLLVDGTKNLDF